MLRLSLKWRIGFYAAMVLLIAISVISGIAYHEFEEAMIDSLDYRLQSDARAIQNIIIEEESLSDAVSQIDALLNSKTNQDQGAFKIWFEEHDELITSDANTDSLLLKVIEANPVMQWEDDYFTADLIYKDEPLRVIWARYPTHTKGETSPKELNIFISIRASFAQHELAEFLKALLIISGVVIWLGIGGLFMVLRWGLRPLEEMTEKMEQVSDHPLEGSGMNTADTVKELRPFVTSWTHMLERLSISMEKNKRFTADASHELRTPLTVIKSTLQLARSQRRTPEFYEKAIDESLEDIDRMNRLIDKLLELSRLDYLLPTETLKSIDLQRLIEELVIQLEPKALNCGKTLQTSLCRTQIEGDQIQLRQMLENLLENAIRYSPEQSTISVSMKMSPSHLEIIVHDEGGAITPQEQSHIFDRFYRIDKARDRKSGGTGLGLSIAYEIAQRHGGTITVSSSPDIGTDFTISLPESKHESF